MGDSGDAVTMLGVGGWHLGRMSEREAEDTVEAAIGGGIRFFDCAESYQNGGSEERLGRLLVPKYRDVVFLMTKSLAQDARTAREHLEATLRRLKTDYLDLWQMHSLETPEDAESRLRSGVLDVFREAQASGKVRHIGFTGHRIPDAHLRMLELAGDSFQTCQMPVNLADPSYNSFIKQVMPRLVERKIAILGMKSLANGGFFGGSRQGEHGDKPHLVPNRVSMAEAIHFVWSLPVSAIITGPDRPAHLREKIGLARSFMKMDDQQRQSLVSKVADLAVHGGIEFYKA